MADIFAGEVLKRIFEICQDGYSVKTNVIGVHITEENHPLVPHDLMIKFDVCCPKASQKAEEYGAAAVVPLKSGKLRLSLRTGEKAAVLGYEDDEMWRPLLSIGDDGVLHLVEDLPSWTGLVVESDGVIRVGGSCKEDKLWASSNG